MKKEFSKHIFLHLLIGLSLSIPTYLFAAQVEYHSQLINKSKQAHSNGFKLVKTRMWPNAGCLLDTGKAVLTPNESTMFKINKDKNCNQAGIGYEIYRMEDTQNKHVLGYLSHRFADGKFSVQISRFCEGDKCIFVDLNPEQRR